MHCLMHCQCRSPVKAPRPGTGASGAKRKRGVGGDKPSVKKAKPADNGAKKEQPVKKKAKKGI